MMNSLASKCEAIFCESTLINRLYCDIFVYNLHSAADRLILIILSSDHYKIKMRSQQALCIRNQPMRSPSPDIANRNIIGDTKAPIEDIKRYIQKGKSSKSPNPIQYAADLQKCHQEQQQLKQRIKQLQYRNQQLQAENAHFKQLLEQQNWQPQLQVRDTLRSRYSSRAGSPKEHEYLHQMKEMLMKLTSENSRIASLLEKQISLTAHLQEDNQRLQQQLQGRRGQLQNNNNQIQEYFESRVESALKESEMEWERKLEELNRRLEKIQQTQVDIETRISQRNSEITPLKQSSMRSSRKKTTDPSRAQPSIKHTQSITAFNVQQSERSLKQQIQALRAKIKQLQARKIKQSQISSNSSKEGESKNSQRSNNFLKSKIDELEEQLSNNLSVMRETQNQLKVSKQELIACEQKYENAVKLLEKERDEMKRCYEGERRESAEIRIKLSKLEDQYRVLMIEANAADLEKYKLELKERYEKKQATNRQYYESLLSGKDEDTSEQLQKYLAALQAIKKRMQQFCIEQVVFETESAVKKALMLQSQITKVKDESNRTMSALKKQLMAKQQVIIEHEKTIFMLRTEIEQMEQQKQKMKEAMLKMEECSPILTTEQQIAYKSQNLYKLRQSIEETLVDIENLESEMVEGLRGEE